MEFIDAGNNRTETVHMCPREMQGASHVIVTSYVFHDGKASWKQCKHASMPQTLNPCGSAPTCH